MRRKSGDNQSHDTDELFDVRELVAGDPEAPPKAFSRKSERRSKKTPEAKKTRTTSSKSTIYIFIAMGVAFALILIPAVIFLFIRYVLPPFQ